MSTSNCQRQIQVEFTYEGFVMGRLLCNLLMTTESKAENSQKSPMSEISCIENTPNLRMTNSTCIENCIFLNMTETK